MYSRCVARHLALGSTTVSYFGTIHTEGTLELAEQCEALGQRAHVGKVSMDRNAPGYYVERDAESAALRRPTYSEFEASFFVGVNFDTQSSTGRDVRTKRESSNACAANVTRKAPIHNTPIDRFPNIVGDCGKPERPL